MDEQVTASDEFCSTNYHENMEIRSGIDQNLARSATLARRITAREIQAVHHSLQVPPWSGPIIPGRPVAGIDGRRHLRSAKHGQLDYSGYKLAPYGKRAFAYAGPSLWNSLPDNLKLVASLDFFKKQLNSFSLMSKQDIQCTRDIVFPCDSVLYKFNFSLHYILYYKSLK